MGNPPRIKMIDFGGTWCMEEETQGQKKVLVPKRSLEEVVNETKLSKIINFDLPIPPSDPKDKGAEIKKVDSTNITPHDWTNLANIIAKYQDGYDGIFVAHGTDTMAYTATAISLAFGRGLKIPVVFTGSQLRSSASGTDAYFNFENAGETLVKAHENNIAEVMITFGKKVLRANRAIKVSEAEFEALDSPAFSPLATITATGVKFNTNITLKRSEGKPPPFKPHFKGKILTIDVVPGLETALLRHAVLGGKDGDRCSGLLLRSLGAGNVPTISPEYSPLKLIRNATDANIPVLVSTKFVGGHTLAIYEPGAEALKAGAIHTRDLTDVAAQVKFMWILNYLKKFTRKEIKRKIEHNYVGEITPKPRKRRKPKNKKRRS